MTTTVRSCDLWIVTQHTQVQKLINGLYESPQPPFIKILHRDGLCENVDLLMNSGISVKHGFACILCRVHIICRISHSKKLIIILISAWLYHLRTSFPLSFLCFLSIGGFRYICESYWERSCRAALSITRPHYSLAPTNFRSFCLIVSLTLIIYHLLNAGKIHVLVIRLTFSPG